MKRQIAEQVLRILNGGDYSVSDSKWDIREIELVVSQNSAKLFRNRIYEQYTLGEGNSLGQYVATFRGVPVKDDTDRNLKYIDIPAKYLSLPRERGVNSIGPEKNEFVKFIPCELGILNIYGTRNAPFLQGNTGYWVEGMKAYFTKDDTKGPLVVKLVTTDTVEENIPEDLQADIIALTLQYFQAKPEDKLNNANEDAGGSKGN
jgi:hypothetical protein